MDADQIRLALEALRHDDLPTHSGQTLAYVYDSGLPEADAIGREALAAFASSNALDPTAFPSLLQMEQDLIGLAAYLLDGPPENRRHRHLGWHRVCAAGGAGRPRCASGDQRARHGAADLGARGIPQ